MVEYTTLEELRAFNRDLPLTERVQIQKSAANRSPHGATFLSHSSKDAEFLPGIIRLLENHGASVYVDKIDESLPTSTSPETAKVLRERIGEASKFILLATSKSKDSRWMPWELGVADGLKQPGRVAIFPGVDSQTDTEWAEQEYLGLYDRVVWGELQGHTDNMWLVWNYEKNTATTLRKWLSA